MRQWVALDGAPRVQLRHDKHLTIAPFGCEVGWALDGTAAAGASSRRWCAATAVIGEVSYAVRVAECPEWLRGIVEATRPTLPPDC
jgi:hypothetical protein